MENYQNNTKEEIPMWRPAIRSAYDYYPFGMLMPGRYVSDTSRHCVTLSRPHWVWKWTLIGCKDYYAWVWPKLTLMGAATATPSENGILLNAQRLGEGMSFELNAQPNTENQFQLELNGLEMAKDAALQILEQNGEEEWTVLAEVPIKDGEGLTVPFYPSLGKVKVVLLGPIRVLIRRVCVEGMAWVEENQLVAICDGDGDRYRFGFNGQEKVNEWAGVGNHVDFGERGFDTRIGRLGYSVDPLFKKVPWQSSYTFAGNNPILFIDRDGEIREIYTIIIDDRTGNTIINKKTTNQLQRITRIHNESVFGKKTSTWVRTYDWHDYQTFKEIHITKDGKALTTSIVDRTGIFRTNTNYDWGEGYANKKLSIQNVFKPVAEKGHDGYMFTTKNALVAGNEGSKYNARGNGPSVNIDGILSAFSMASAASTVNKPESVVDLVQYMVTSYNTAGDAQELAPINVSKKDGPVYCKTCHDTYMRKDGELTQEKSTNKAIDTVPSH